VAVTGRLQEGVRIDTGFAKFEVNDDTKTGSKDAQNATVNEDFIVDRISQ